MFGVLAIGDKVRAISNFTNTTVEGKIVNTGPGWFTIQRDTAHGPDKYMVTTAEWEIRTVTA